MEEKVDIRDKKGVSRTSLHVVQIMISVDWQMTETIIDNVGVKRIFFNYAISSCLISIFVLFLMSVIHSTPRLPLGAVLSLMTLLMVSLAIECAHQIVLWRLLSHDSQSLTERQHFAYDVLGSPLT